MSATPNKFHENHPFGRPISLLKISDSNVINMDDEAIDNIFNHPEVENRKIVVLSLIGALRGGKSFFLDYCLRFLYANVSLKLNLKILFVFIYF